MIDISNFTIAEQKAFLADKLKIVHNPEDNTVNIYDRTEAVTGTMTVEALEQLKEENILTDSIEFFDTFDYVYEVVGRQDFNAHDSENKPDEYQDPTAQTTEGETIVV